MRPGYLCLLALARSSTYDTSTTTFAPDGSYVLGPVPRVEGLFVATGCAALGIAGSAAVGQWLSRWMLEGNPGVDLGHGIELV